MQSYQQNTALLALIQAASLYQVALDPKTIFHQFAVDGAFGHTALMRALKVNAFHAKEISCDIASIKLSTLPAIIVGKDDYFVLVGVNDQQEYLVILANSNELTSLSSAEFSQLFNGKVIYLNPKNNTSKDKAFNIKWFIPALWKYKHVFRDVFIASFFLQLFALVTPLFFQVVMDKVVVHQALTTLEILAIGFVAVSIFEVILGAIRTYLFAHTTSRVDVELGTKLYQHLLSLPLAYFEARQVGLSVARVKELDSIREFLTSSALTLLIDLGFTFIFFAVMWFYSAQLTLIVLATIPCYVVLSLLITPILKARLDQAFKEGAKNQAFLTESLTGIQTVKSSAIEPQMQHKWEDNLANYVRTNFRARNLSNITSQIAQFISKITTLLIIFLGVNLVMSGDLTIGQLIAFNMLAGRVTSPILKVVQLWQDFQQARISLKRLGDILNTTAEGSTVSNNQQLAQLSGSIEFKNLTFHYGINTPAVLKEINFNVQANQTVGIVGRSGSGKSTLAKLLQKLYLPQSGSILLDGADISALSAVWLRQQIGVVSQESFLFNRSIRENIALTCPGASLDVVINAAKLSGADEFIVKLKHGYDTIVEEQGANFSGGQKQRIAIARALINEPKILIFDEATSALDYESERMIQQNMREITQNRTVFIIAHRLSTVMHCDKIIYLEAGKVVEEGSHNELLALGGHYAKLYRAQFVNIRG
ncbi:type I secretion system permease/ATPase [Cysteiniphilum sp. JM-1]|uniref:type I secretion system permease/ATPase n=1 Tax=Cysteiniphilum sp. JM-1 TaxID=2610891 RepID=UPI001246DFEE|nr:type I secretion system permease/ATPase [Cysteiniphilum sp. JM-1]